MSVLDDLKLLLQTFGRVVEEKVIRDFYDDNGQNLDLTSTHLNILYREELETSVKSSAKYPQRIPQKRKREYRKKYERNMKGNNRNRFSQYRSRDQKYRSERKRRRGNDDKIKQISSKRSDLESLFDRVRKGKKWIDLHGLTVREAKEVIDDQIMVWKDRGVQKAEIIVGKGKHSFGKICCISDSIQSYLRKNGIRYHVKISNSGVLCLNL